jgi:FtsH-binding integral membrane protein
MENFKNWQQDNKHISHKVSMDNASRVKRAISFLGTENIVPDSLKDLETNTCFKALSVSVKSQIRRAMRLYIEFINTI